jgi:hypothetical protein
MILKTNEIKDFGRLPRRLQRLTGLTDNSQQLNMMRP